jgi:hypothetical protein
VAVSDYRRVLEDASRLTQSQQERLIKKLAAQLMKSGGQLNLSKTEDTVAFVERMRAAESRHANGRLKSPKEFLAEIESWEG